MRIVNEMAARSLIAAEAVVADVGLVLRLEVSRLLTRQQSDRKAEAPSAKET